MVMTGCKRQKVLPCLSIVYLFVLFDRGCASVEFDESMTAIFVKAVEGTAVEIPCDCHHHDHKPRRGHRHVTWTKLGEEESLVISRGKGRGDVKVGDDWKEAKVAINGTALSIKSLKFPRDDGRFVCEAARADRSVTVTVLASARDAVIVGVRTIDGSPRVDVSDGNIATVECRVQANPAPAFRWTLGINPISGALYPNTNDPLSSQVSFEVTRDMEAQLITCTTENYLGDSAVASAYLRVLYPPSDVSVVTLSKNQSFVEGSQVTFRCRATGEPRPTLRWHRITADGSTEFLSDRAALYRIMSVRRSEAGTYRCTAINSQGNSSGAVAIKVMYPPILKVTFDERKQMLTCEATADSGAVSFRDWQQRLGGTVITTKSAQPSGGVSRLRLSQNLEDTGYYYCSASNAAGGSEAAYYFQPETRPVFEHHVPEVFGSRIGRPLKIEILYYANPEPSIVRWDKSQVDGVLHSRRRNQYIQSQKATNVTIQLGGTEVQILGTAAIFTIRRLTWSDGGNYSLTLGNDRGLSVHRFHVSVQRPRRGRSEAGKLGPLGAGLIVVGSCVLLLLLLLMGLWMCGKCPGQGQKSSSRRDYSPTADPGKSKPLREKEKPTEAFREVSSPSDVMLKDDLNDNFPS